MGDLRVGLLNDEVVPKGAFHADDLLSTKHASQSVHARQKDLLRL